MENQYNKPPLTNGNHLYYVEKYHQLNKKFITKFLDNLYMNNYEFVLVFYLFLTLWVT